MSEVSAPWLHATLADAAESLAAALEKLEAHTDEETASELLRRDLVEVYAKLNYAVLPDFERLFLHQRSMRYIWTCTPKAWLPTGNSGGS